MKRILTDNITENIRRQPFTKTSLEHIQEAFQEVLMSILKNFTENTTNFFRLYGLIDLDGGADYNISAGAVYYNGEVYQVDAFSATAVGGQVPVLTITTTYHANDPVRFSDNNDFNVHEIRKIVISLATPGSGDVDFAGLVDVGIPAEAEARIAADNLKANKAQSAWVNIPLINGWAAFGSNTPQYRTDEFGHVYLRGQLDASASSSAVITDSLPIPLGGHLLQFATVLGDGSGYAKLGINASPGRLSVTVTDYNTSNRYRLEQIHYWTV